MSALDWISLAVLGGVVLFAEWRDNWSTFALLIYVDGLVMTAFHHPTRARWRSWWLRRRPDIVARHKAMRSRARNRGASQ